MKAYHTNVNEFLVYAKTYNSIAVYLLLTGFSAKLRGGGVARRRARLFLAKGVTISRRRRRP